MKLYDFAYAGRGENTRLMLTLSVTPFEDCRVQRHEWPDLKPAAPFGQLPFLELDSGDKIAQQAAIGFEPEDLLRRARGDEVRGLIDDLATLLTPSFAIADREERIAARQQLLEGSLRDLLTCMTKCVERCSGSFLGGDEISLGDISLFTCLSGLTSGYFDGFKPELLQDWPELKTFRNRVAQVEGVRNYYAADSKYKAFQPDTDA